MRVEKINFHKIILTEKEKEAFEIASLALKRFTEDYSDLLILENVSTGEIIEIDEIPRTRGVLSFFYGDMPIIAEIREK